MASAGMDIASEVAKSKAARTLLLQRQPNPDTVQNLLCSLHSIFHLAYLSNRNDCKDGAYQ